MRNEKKKASRVILRGRMLGNTRSLSKTRNSSLDRQAWRAASESRPDHRDLGGKRVGGGGGGGGNGRELVVTVSIYRSDVGFASDGSDSRPDHVILG